MGLRPYKTCTECGSQYQRAERESWQDWERRKFCGLPCRDAAKRTNIKERLRSNTQRAENGCLLWVGSRNYNGYGILNTRFKHSPKLAHRESYAAYIGPIPIGAHVLHRCDNPACVEPTHLFLGDHYANMDDKARKGRAGVKLTLEQASQIFQLKRAGAETRYLADKFHVSTNTINDIASGRMWVRAFTPGILPDL